MGFARRFSPLYEQSGFNDTLRMNTVAATINSNGEVHLPRPLKLDRPAKAPVTILPDDRRMRHGKRGKPCIKDTRIPAALVLGYLAANRDTTAILREFPGLKAEDVTACLDYARELAEFNAVAA